MLEFLRKLFDTEGFPPRWQCGWAWTSELGWLHIASDVVIWGSYTAIPIVLAIFLTRRKDVPFPRIFWLFVAFIFFCGTTHLIEAIIFWQPVYRLSGLFKFGTAVVSLATVCALIPAMPRALAFRSPDDLEREVDLRTRNLQESEEHQRILMRELDHRVKNNITAIMSLADQTMYSTGELSAFRDAFMGRLAAMARTHDALSASRWSGAKLQQIADLTLTPYTSKNEHPVTFIGGDIRLTPKAASSLCMALHEMATNSVKYGSLSVSGGAISLSWSIDADGIQLHWIERGGPPVEPPERIGFGSTFLRGVIEHDLQGSVELLYPREGFECRMFIPSDQFVASTTIHEEDSESGTPPGRSTP